MSKHWDVDEDYVSDVTNSLTLFSRVQATDEEMTLAASAPELLEALQAVVRVADRQTDEFDAARAAISKALGQ